MQKKWKIILGAAAALIALVFIITQIFDRADVEVKEMSRGDVVQSFSEEGIVTSPIERTIFSIYNARVQSLTVEEGDRVSEGELLATLDDRELNCRLEELSAQLKRLQGEERQLWQEPGDAEVEGMKINIAQAEDSLEAAQNNYERIQYLYENEIASEVELEEAESLLKEAEHNLAKQEAALAALRESYQPSEGSEDVIQAQRTAVQSQINFIRYQKNNYRIHTPISGVVTNLNAEEGNPVGPQTPMMEVFYEGNYVVETRVLTHDIFNIYEGMPVELSFEADDEDIVFPGELTEIAPYAEEDVSPLGLEEERVKVTITPEIPEGLELAPGYKLDVEFITESLSNKITVPKMALFTYEGEDALFVVENNRVRVRTVTTGIETRHDTVITDGLEEGDLVIIDHQIEGIDEGARVSYSIINDS